ncbi:flagellar basal body rod protein FlgB [Halalkalibacter alkaliphilus]|uniref:Flagellar basal body rod protein FlgB n=1 Tax=Halalkalibacter alkaliphilus TaxID=2917993 RepID=A0A9X2A6J5_9BACI|nr:flagellar basal body rod protein FlgB [Halalkalibacter alkaliphilus]MCL7746461.1 flagellar basal body rod protein FlgB [Halalkalibacter alkaliphilus]
MDLFGSSTFKTLERGLAGAQVRQNAISQNIANVDTPNYKAKQVSFKHTLNDAMNHSALKANRTNDHHYEFSRAKNSVAIETNRSTMYNHNGNNVDIDLEMAELAKNQIYYNALIDRLNGRFTSLQTVIRGGN